MAIIKTEIRPKKEDGTYNDVLYPKTSADMVEGLPTSLPANGGNADTVDNRHFLWENPADVNPTFIWGNTNDNANQKLFKPSQLSVGNADTVDGKHATDFRPSTWTPTKADVGLGNVPNYGASTSVTSTSTTTLATSSAVKQAYDKGVEALNAATDSNKVYQASNTLITTVWNKAIASTNQRVYLGKFVPKYNGILRVKLKFNSVPATTNVALDIKGVFGMRGELGSYSFNHYPDSGSIDNLSIGTVITSSVTDGSALPFRRLFMRSDGALENILDIEVYKGSPLYFVSDRASAGKTVTVQVLGSEVTL